MKILFILILVLFIIKKNKPHVAFIQLMVKLFTVIGSTFGFVAQMIINFWASVAMEISCAKKPDDAKSIREDFAHWIAMRKDYNGWISKMEAIGKKDHPNHYSYTSHIVTSIKHRNWACCRDVYDAEGGIIVLAVMTWIVLVIGAIIFMVA